MIEEISFMNSFRENYLSNLIKSRDLQFIPLFEEASHGFPKLITHDDVVETKNWFEKVHQLSFLAPFLEEDFEELILHNEKVLHLKGKGKTKVFEIKNLSTDEHQLALEVMAQYSDVSWNHTHPYASFKIELQGQAYRCTLIHHSLTPGLNSKLFLRSMKIKPYPLSSFCQEKFDLSDLISLIEEKKNLLIAGGTGSGKTTLLRSLLAHVDSKDHILVLEDTYEITPQNPSQSNLLSQKNKNQSLTDYCAYALRLRPDRMVIGEMRSNEVIPFLLAMNTGHNGLMSTVHANSATEALSRVALLFALYQEGHQMSFDLVLQLICQNIDYVVFLKEKKIETIAKVLGAEGSTPYIENL